MKTRFDLTLLINIFYLLPASTSEYYQTFFEPMNVGQEHAAELLWDHFDKPSDDKMFTKIDGDVQRRQYVFGGYITRDDSFNSKQTHFKHRPCRAGY